MKAYYYLHTNGDLIHKPVFVVDSDPGYFDSPFVKKFWKIDLTNRGDAWNLVLEALAMGASIERIRKLSIEWGLTLKDLKKMMLRVSPTELMKDGLPIFTEKILNTNIEDICLSLQDSENK